MSQSLRAATIILLCSGTFSCARSISMLRALRIPVGIKQLRVSLANGSLVEATYDQGRTPFHIYALVGEWHLMNAILANARMSRQANLSLILNGTCNAGNTALHFACLGAHPLVVRHLLAEGASTKPINHEGKTAREIAEELPTGEARIEILALFDTYR